jgi:hypothetical protein
VTNIVSMQKCISLVLLSVFLYPSQLSAKILDVSPVAQQRPELCWAASAEMILSYYGVPNLNPVGDYQCAVIAAQGSPCNINCGIPICLAGGGTAQRITAVLRQYVLWASQISRSSIRLKIRNRGILSPREISSSIDNGSPILAGISPQMPFPPGLGVSQHAVVIIGYENTSRGFEVVFNDPSPYATVPPYLEVGGRALQFGQFQLSYNTFIQVFNYGNSITFTTRSQRSAAAQRTHSARRDRTPPSSSTGGLLRLPL